MSEEKRRFLCKAQIVFYGSKEEIPPSSNLLCGYLHFKVFVVFILCKFASLGVVFREKSLENELSNENK